MESDRSMAPIAGERAQFRVQAKDMYSNNVRIGGVEFQLVFEVVMSCEQHFSPKMYGTKKCETLCVACASRPHLIPDFCMKIM